jgi:hypothetical protein
MWVVIGVVQGLTNLWDYREYKKYHTNYSNGIQHTGGDTR